MIGPIEKDNPQQEYAGGLSFSFDAELAVTI